MVTWVSQTVDPYEFLLCSHAGEWKWYVCNLTWHVSLLLLNELHVFVHTQINWKSLCRKRDLEKSGPTHLVRQGHLEPETVSSHSLNLFKDDNSTTSWSNLFDHTYSKKCFIFFRTYTGFRSWCHVTGFSVFCVCFAAVPLFCIQLHRCFK